MREREMDDTSVLKYDTYLIASLKKGNISAVHFVFKYYISIYTTYILFKNFSDIVYQHHHL